MPTPIVAGGRLLVFIGNPSTGRAESGRLPMGRFHQPVPRDARRLGQGGGMTAAELLPVPSGLCRDVGGLEGPGSRVFERTVDEDRATLTPQSTYKWGASLLKNRSARRTTSNSSQDRFVS